MHSSKTRVPYDHLHTALLDQIFRTTDSNRHTFPHEFSALVDRLEEEFRAMENMLEATACATVVAHREQHARVLANLRWAISALQAGNHVPAMHGVRDLGLWLPHHLVTVDAELAQATGGAMPLAACH